MCGRAAALAAAGLKYTADPKGTRPYAPFRAYGVYFKQPHGGRAEFYAKPPR